MVLGHDQRSPRRRVTFTQPPLPTTLYIDADACPVKDDAVRVAERQGLDSTRAVILAVSQKTALISSVAQRT